MKRLFLPLLLVLSLGVNIGLVVDQLAGSDRQANRTEDAQATADDAAERQLPPRLQKRLERMAGDLALEGEARERFLELQRQFFARTIDSTEKARSARRELRQVLLSEMPNRARAEELLHQAGAAQTAVEVAFVDNFFETRALLESPEQLRRFQRFMRRVRQMREEMETRRDDRRRRFLDRTNPQTPARENRGDARPEANR